MFSENETKYRRSLNVPHFLDLVVDAVFLVCSLMFLPFAIGNKLVYIQ